MAYRIIIDFDEKTESCSHFFVLLSAREAAFRAINVNGIKGAKKFCAIAGLYRVKSADSTADSMEHLYSVGEDLTTP